VPAADLDARARTLAPIVAAGIVAQAVAGNAGRDALFLTHYPVTALPYFVAGAALLSLPAAQVSGRLLARLGPGRLVPWLLGANGALFLVEWALLDAVPRLASGLLYVHGAVVGGVAISAFWSLLNERFDPHSAKPLLARVAGAATFGGLVGGVGAERVAALASPRALLAVIALVGAVAAVASSAVARGAPPRRQRPADPKEARPWAQIRRNPFVRDLALVILLAAAVAALTDYALKVEAVSHFPKGQPLVRFFGLFYAGTGLVAFLIQSALGKTVLARLGLAGSVGAHPAAVAAAGALGFFVPTPWRGVLPRGADVCVRNSVFRAGYELLYTPLPEATKRSAKPVIDVGWDSIGKGAGAAVVLALTHVPAAWAFAAVNAAAIAAAAVELGLARRLRAGYVRALEGGLVRGGGDLEQAADYSLSDFTLVESLAGLDRAGLQRALGVGAGSPGTEWAPPADPVVAAIADLRSGDPARLRGALRALPRDPLLVGALVPLLGRRDVLRQVVAALESFGARASAQLVDALLDPATPDAVRRRLPAVLRSCASPMARDGLVAGLGLTGLELRLRCSRALVALTEQGPGLVVPREAALAAVELALAEGGDPRLLREHLLNLLTLGLEREPAGIAARALDTDDAHLRGTALEYYETVLPPALFAALEPRLAAARPVARPVARPSEKRRSAGEVREELVKAGATMTMSLEEVRRQVAAVRDDQP
jgi:ATP:ADP antiporter, AAA family